ncbi:MAG: helix-turn-helix domain-containing protein [Ancalomicrobiaceae bacterium]|nr:helix-turn-helix domain-containing protein [Ancalomicrobiaceae bacterium]
MFIPNSPRVQVLPESTDTPGPASLSIGPRAGEALSGEARSGEECVPAPIQRSWQRSFATGLGGHSAPDVRVMSFPRFKQLRQENEALLRAARGEMEALSRDMSATGGVVILADRNGVILHAVGRGAFAETVRRLDLREGAGWDETTIGTSAIGAALVEGQAISVNGAEHFFDLHGDLNCSAVPVLDSTGQIVGVLDVTHAADVPQTHALALVSRAVEQIEYRLFQAQFRDHERISFHSDPYLIGSAHEGVVALEDDRVVGANRHALELLKIGWKAVGEAHVGQIFKVVDGSFRRKTGSDDCVVRTRSGHMLHAQVTARRPGSLIGPAPIEVSSEAVGSVPNAAHDRGAPVAAASPAPLPPRQASQQQASADHCSQCRSDRFAARQGWSAFDRFGRSLSGPTAGSGLGISGPRDQERMREIVERLMQGPLVRQFDTRKVRAGQLIYGADVDKASPLGLLIVRSGRLRGFSSFEGKELTLFTLDAGEVVPIDCNSTFEVKKDGEIVILSMATFEGLAHCDPDLAISAVPAIYGMLQKSLKTIEDMVFRGVRERFIRVLCDTAERDGQESLDGIVIETPPKAEEFAMQIGATRQSVSSIIAELIRDGLVRRLGATAMVIADMDRLRQQLG